MRSSERCRWSVSFSPATSEADANRMNAIRGSLKDAGYIEGEKVMIEYRSAENQPGSPKN